LPHDRRIVRIRHSEPGSATAKDAHLGEAVDDEIVDDSGKEELGGRVAPVLLQEPGEALLEVSEDGGREAPEVHRHDLVAREFAHTAFVIGNPGAVVMTLDAGRLDDPLQHSLRIAPANTAHDGAMVGESVSRSR